MGLIDGDPGLERKEWKLKFRGDDHVGSSENYDVLSETVEAPSWSLINFEWKMRGVRNSDNQCVGKMTIPSKKGMFCGFYV